MPRFKRRSRVMGLVPSPVPPVDPVVPPVVPPVAPGAPAVPPTPPAPAAPDPAKTYDEAYVKGIREEAAAARIAKKNAEDALAALQNANLTAEQKVAADLKKYQEETVPNLLKENQKLQVQVIAGSLGIVDPEVASMLIDWKAVETGKSITDALNDVLATRAYLKAPSVVPPIVVPPVVPPIAPTAPPSGSAPATPPGTGPARIYTRSELLKMSKAEMAANLADINLAASTGRIDQTR